MSIDFWRRLFRRWFIEYNPLYLLSAGSVLVGVNELSAGLSRSPYSGFAVAAVAELYAWALIGSAALLMRIELRRPAVMLALLAVIYQCDPTLHTETCAYLGGIGVLAGGVWFISFVAKLLALASAMRVRLSRSALFLPTIGALGALLIPPYLRQANGSSMSSLVALWVFGLFAFGLWGAPRITSLLALDGWGKTVLKRAVRAIWSIFFVLTLSHVWFWTTEFELRATLIVPVLLLLSTRWMSRESRVWLAVAVALAIGLMMPTFFATIAGMAAITLALRAMLKPRELPAQPERLRLIAGSATLLYFAAWTLHWSGGALPAHAWWCDSALSVALLSMVWHWRTYSALVPVALNLLHLGVQSGTVSLPRTRTQWGLSEVGLGFALLAVATLTNWLSKSGRAESSAADTPDDPTTTL